MKQEGYCMECMVEQLKTSLNPDPNEKKEEGNAKQDFLPPAVVPSSDCCQG